MAGKQITFAGSTVGEPWWTLGEIVAEVLKPHGYEVKVVHESYSDNNIRWITRCQADVGAVSPVHARSAVKGIHEYRGEKHANLTSIATIKRPCWVALAVRHETGISGLREVKKRKYPLRILASSPDKGSLLDTVLRHYGTNLDEIEGWGGKFMKWSGRMLGGYVREGAVDMMIGNIYLGYTPHNRFWYEATMLYDMRFLGFDKVLIDRLVEKYGYKRGVIPHGLFRGIEREIPSVLTNAIYIYCLKSLPSSLVRLIAEGLDRNIHLFKNARSVLYYEREEVWKNPTIPLHPAAEEYYRSKGYMR